jgi:hypothetical protein
LVWADGRSFESGPHLHWGGWPGGIQVDPNDWLETLSHKVSLQELLSFARSRLDQQLLDLHIQLGRHRRSDMHSSQLAVSGNEKRLQNTLDVISL